MNVYLATVLVLAAAVCELQAGPLVNGGRIRPLICKSKNSPESGICMFALECIKLNGSSLGACADRYHIGSCCRLPVTTVTVTQTESSSASSVTSTAAAVPVTESSSANPVAEVTVPQTESSSADPVTTPEVTVPATESDTEPPTEIY